MPTFTLIQPAVVVGAGGAASMTFTSIPATYTDLVIKVSGLANATEGMYIQFNGSTSNFSGRYLIAETPSVASGSLARYVGTNAAVTSVPNNTEIYIPNYAGSTNKSFSVDNVAETNASLGYLNLISGLWSSTAAITSITIETANSFKQHSTAYLYGVSNA